MSAGQTLLTVYESYYDVGGLYPIRIQPESASASIGTVSNSPPSGVANRAARVKVTNSRRGAGLKPRLLYLKIALGSDPPPDYKLDSRTYIPALTESFYKLAITTKQIEYLNGLWIVTGGSPEYLH